MRMCRMLEEKIAGEPFDAAQFERMRRFWFALGWLLLYFTIAEEDRPNWWRVHLSLNLSFAIIFAACGAAAAFALQYRSSRGEDRLTKRD
jgi:hypothetical protein